MCLTFALSTIGLPRYQSNIILTWGDIVDPSFITTGTLDTAFVKKETLSKIMPNRTLSFENQIVIASRKYCIDLGATLAYLIEGRPTKNHGNAYQIYILEYHLCIKFAYQLNFIKHSKKILQLAKTSAKYGNSLEK